MIVIKIYDRLEIRKVSNVNQLFDVPILAIPALSSLA